MPRSRPPSVVVSQDHCSSRIARITGASSETISREWRAPSSIERTRRDRASPWSGSLGEREREMLTCIMRAEHHLRCRAKNTAETRNNSGPPRAREGDPRATILINHGPGAMGDDGCSSAPPSCHPLKHCHDRRYNVYTRPSLPAYPLLLPEEDLCARGLQKACGSEACVRDEGIGTHVGGDRAINHPRSASAYAYLQKEETIVSLVITYTNTRIAALKTRIDVTEIPTFRSARATLTRRARSGNYNP